MTEAYPDTTALDTIDKTPVNTSQPDGLHTYDVIRAHNARLLQQLLTDPNNELFRKAPDTSENTPQQLDDTKSIERVVA